MNNSFGETEIQKLSLISLLYMVVDLNSKCILTLANPDACIFTILVLTWIIALIWSMLSTLFRCCISNSLRCSLQYTEVLLEIYM